MVYVYCMYVGAVAFFGNYDDYVKSSEFVLIAATKGEGQSASNDESETSGGDSADLGVAKSRVRLNSNWSEVNNLRW